MMGRLRTCTWASATLARPKLITGTTQPSYPGIGTLEGPALMERLLAPARRAESLGIDYLLIAQRWWGSGEEMEGSSFDCLGMTAFYAAHTTRLTLISAIHPGFYLPAAIAKWGATMSRLTGDRWAINVTSGWHAREFGMYGADWLEHDTRYARSTEFVEIVRRAWAQEELTYTGHFYQVQNLRLEPRPVAPRLQVFQGGQSPAAMDMAAHHADWMFLNGGPLEKIRRLIAAVRSRTARTGRTVRFVLYAIPLCRATDAEAEEEMAAMVAAQDTAMVARRRLAVSGAHGMWSSPEDPLTMLDPNEGYASRLIGSPSTILERMQAFHALGIDCFHLTLTDERFNTQVLPEIQTWSRDAVDSDRPVA